jgi:hypothetical protein
MFPSPCGGIVSEQRFATSMPGRKQSKEKKIYRSIAGSCKSDTNITAIYQPGPGRTPLQKG